MTHPLHQLLENDMNEIKPDVVLEKRISNQFAPRKLRNNHPWRLPVFSGVITAAVLAVMVLTNSAQNGQPSLIAQAEAAYADLQAKLSEPGAVRHTVTKITGENNQLIAEHEVWLTHNNAQILSGPLGNPGFLRVNGEMYRNMEEPSTSSPQCATTEEGEQCVFVITVPDNAPTDTITVVDGVTISTGVDDEGEEENSGPSYMMVPPGGGGSIMQQIDPADDSVICADWTPLTAEQEAARQTMGEIQRASNALTTGEGQAEDLLTILKNSSNIEDRGVESDPYLGNIHLYRLSYAPVGDDPTTTKAFSEFGLSTDTGMVRLNREGYVDTSGKETLDITTRILVDEILSASEVPEDLFSPERLGFEKIEPLPTPVDHPENLPTFELKSGCYREGADAPEWLNSEDEAAARARIAADPNAGSMGGGGF